MPPPSAIAIATSSVNRLVKDEASYHKELQNQEARVAKLLASTMEDENAEYQLKQENIAWTKANSTMERTAIEETRAIFPPLRQRIDDAVYKLQDQLEAGKANGASDAEISAATETIKKAKEVSSQK
ncbi:tubulin binding cofactor A [Amylocarpus encephaloides]|uniref:Tubulin-specific chaperone A n=1 Tax=Amylocarpus encephaloides TaxID=45428 RepID=A0A9P7YRW7_9HELO|nr:tubulin binding cofactor A [Amylocarpus encephaloides]